MDLLQIEILVEFFFFVSCGIWIKAHKDERKIIEQIFKVISIILGIASLISLIDQLSPYL
jgi:hypothetical protein